MDDIFQDSVCGVFCDSGFTLTGPVEVLMDPS